MKLNKKLGLAAAGIAIAAAATGCTSSQQSTGQQTENQQQQQDTNSLVNDQPIPHYKFSQIRQTLIDAENIAANGTQTTSFFFQMGNTDPVFSCPSLGMPVANTAQLSNPQQVNGYWDGSVHAQVPTAQMDPYGVYSPSASTGTYVICVNGSGAKYLEYWEGDVMTVAAGAAWDSATHSLKVTGAPTAAIQTKP